MYNILYLHGYGATGDSVKGQKLRQMFSGCNVVLPTMDYDNMLPNQIQDELESLVRRHDIDMLMGSSFGGYHCICATSFFHGPVWTVNPVHDVRSTISRVIDRSILLPEQFNNVMSVYDEFDNKVFRTLSDRNVRGDWPADTPLYFALSTDDELLGSHAPLLSMFPHHEKVVYKDRCGHHFLRFNELYDDILTSIGEEL